jgi:probable HAF family extracellular repeat protein
VGSVGDLVSVVLPARWTDDGYEPLAPLPGPETKSFPWAVNEAGHAVGWSQLSFANTVATLWADGVVHDLNDLVQTELDITLTQAWDVNDHGVIVGVGLFEDTLRAWILTPVIAADVTGDGVVDVLDLVEVILGWGPCPDPCPPTCDADIDGNCTVDVQDLVAVILGWS